MALPAKLMMNRSRAENPINVNNYNTANSSNTNSNSNTMESPPRPSCPAPAQPTQVQYNMEALQEIDLDAILQKEAHLRIGWERMAVTRFSQRQNKE